MFKIKLAETKYNLNIDNLRLSFSGVVKFNDTEQVLDVDSICVLNAVLEHLDIRRIGYIVVNNKGVKIKEK